MVIPLLVMGAMSVFGQSQERNAQYKAQGEQSKAIREANRKNAIRTAFNVGMLNVQRGQQAKELVQRKADLGQQEISAVGSAAANAAASGTIGASVDAVQSDIQKQFEKARAQVSEENEINALNFNTQLYDLITGGQDSMITAKKPTGASDLAIVGNAAAEMANKYFSAKMDLGLGRGGGGPTFRG